MNKNDRLLSLDALRGFDMLFIMGLSIFVSHLCAAFVAFGHLALCWLVLWFLCKKNVFLKV